MYKLPFKRSHWRIQRRIEVVWRRGRRRWKLRWSNRSHSAERILFGRGCGSVVAQTTMSELPAEPVHSVILTLLRIQLLKLLFYALCVVYDVLTTCTCSFFVTSSPWRWRTLTETSGNLSAAGGFHPHGSTDIVNRARRLHRSTHPLLAHVSSYMVQIYELAVKNDNFEVKAKFTL